MDWIVVPLSPADRETADMFNKLIDFAGDITTDILVYGEAFVTGKPSCFGEYPLHYPSERAERCCHDCPFLTACLQAFEADCPPPDQE